ncbi:MAG: hypothetical protein AB9856_00915 [Cellulosilyticaceae bacterium]
MDNNGYTIETVCNLLSSIYDKLEEIEDKISATNEEVSSVESHSMWIQSEVEKLNEKIK